MTDKANSKAISKRHDTNLWAEIRTLYESRTNPNYDKIKTILVAEFALEEFPSKRTVERRAKKEEWKRYEDDTHVRIAPNRYSEDFWLCVRAIYESHPKITHKRLKELVQNELQCADFPSQDVVRAMATKQAWERSDALLKQSDANLKKIRSSVNNLQSIQGTMIISSNEKGANNHIIDHEVDEDEDAEEGNVFDFDAALELAHSKKMGIKNLLMSTQIKRKQMSEIIIKSRKRMMTINDIGDHLTDALVYNNELLTDEEFLRICPSELLERIANQQKRLGQTAGIFNELAFNRRESIKFELSLYGVTIEDLKDVDEGKMVKDLNDDTAYEAQKKRLEEERNRIAERRRYIDSGGLQEDVEAEMQRRMAEAAQDDDEVDEGVFQEVD
jgi:hypothetical protein